MVKFASTEKVLCASGAIDIQGDKQVFSLEEYKTC